MNKDTVIGDWKILKGKIKSAWGKLSDADIDSLKGDMTKLEGHIQKAYGLSKEEATKKYNEFKSKLSASDSSSEEKNKTSYASDVDQPKPRKPDAQH